MYAEEVQTSASLNGIHNAARSCGQTLNRAAERLQVFGVVRAHRAIIGPKASGVSRYKPAHALSSAARGPVSCSKIDSSLSVITVLSRHRNESVDQK
jgi:hypothetical protein